MNNGSGAISGFTNQIMAEANHIQFASLNANSSSSTGGSGAATTVSSVQDLQRKEPKLYKAMLNGMVMNFIGKQEDANERIRKLLKEEYERS